MIMSTKKAFVLFIFIVTTIQKSVSQHIEPAIADVAFTPKIPFPVVSKKGKWDIITQILYNAGEDNDSDLMYQPQITYGLTDHFGVNVFFPLFIFNYAGPDSSSGMSDFYANFEWVFLNEKENQALLQAGLVFPTGDRTKAPPTGVGVYRESVKLSYFHTSEHWTALLDLNAFISNPRNGIHPGNTYFMEWTFGPLFNLAKTGHKDVVVGFNIDAQWLSKRPNRIYGKINTNTGGYVIYAGPLISLEYSTHINFILTYEPAVAQHLFGEQEREKYLATVFLELRF